jgi:hypothetical protein
MSSQKIFFSYSRADSPFALTLAKDLREAGADIWIDQLDIPAGSHWDAAVEKALNGAAYVLVILTPSSTASTNVMDEVSFALESGKKIIPVLLEDCLPPFRLRRLQRIDFTSDYGTGFNQLIASLNLSLGAAAKDHGAPFEQLDADPGPKQSAEADADEKERRDNAHWEEACRINTIASYRKYLNEVPGGMFTDEARLMMKQIEVEQKEEQLEALLWQKAKNEHNKKLYQHYLQEYPQGNYKTLALSAIAEFEKAEHAEEARLKEIALEQEKERAQKAKEEKEAREKLEREQAEKVKAEKEEQARLEKESLQKEKAEKERLAQIEREKVQKEKEEKEKQKALEREQAQKEKAERDRIALIEKEKAAKEKAERDRLAQIEKDKARKEKEAQDKVREEEKQKALLAKQQEKEKLRQERIARGEPAEPPQGKKYAMIGGGVVLLILAIWFMTRGGDEDKSAWKDALSKNDSTAFASYMTNFPEGKFYGKAKERIDSIYWAQKAISDSLSAIASQTAMASVEPPSTEVTTPEPVKTEPQQVTPTKPTTETKPKQAPPQKPKSTTNSGAKPKPTEPAKTPAAKIALGQEHGGGIVVYVNPQGDHGMIVSSKEVGSVDWEKAKKICAAYTSGNVGGWRLPSKAELNIIYQNRKYLGPYTKGNYWSADEEGKNNAWLQNFSNGNQTKGNKSGDAAVRAVRPF